MNKIAADASSKVDMIDKLMREIEGGDCSDDEPSLIQNSSDDEQNFNDQTNMDLL